jgi:hypothetical protein
VQGFELFQAGTALLALQPGYFMPGMKYPPKGPIRPDIIRPLGVNPVGKWKNHFGFSNLPGRPRQVVWSKELGRGACFTP